MGVGGNNCFNIDEKENINNFAQANVIYFDQTISANETHQNFMILKKLVKGAIFGTGDYEILKRVIELIRQSNDPPPFVLISSGSAAEKILNDFHIETFIYDVLIYCNESHKYEHLKNKYSKIRMIENIEFDNILNFLKLKEYKLAQDTKGATFLKSDPLITFSEYEDYYYKYHHLIIQNYNEKCLNLTEKDKKDFLSCVDTDQLKAKDLLDNLENNDNFYKNIIKIYTKESPICYTLNKLLRRCNENSYKSIKNYACSLLYSLYKYYSLNNYSGTVENSLYRQINLKFADILLYKVCEGEIICYPGFTSASYREIFTTDINNNSEEQGYKREDEEVGRYPTHLAKEIVYEKEDVYDFVDIFIENNEDIYYPSAINVSNIADIDFEEERLFPAFSFFRIKKVDISKGSKNEPHKIFLEVIHKLYNLEEKMFQGESVYLDYHNNLLLTRIIKDK